MELWHSVQISSYSMNQSHNKHSLWIMITKKIDHGVHRLHVASVVSILIDEMIKELKRGGSINIHNFGTFVLNDLKPKKIRSIHTNQIKFAKRTKALRFKLTRKIKRYLSRNSINEMKNAVKICEDE